MVQVNALVLLPKSTCLLALLVLGQFGSALLPLLVKFSCLCVPSPITKKGQVPVCAADHRAWGYFPPVARAKTDFWYFSEWVLGGSSSYFMAEFPSLLFNCELSTVTERHFLFSVKGTGSEVLLELLKFKLQILKNKMVVPPTH